ncbi:MAG: prepilin-type N-terminal cleavage/methylation domain-containing protein [Candidatus Komeilibacteria bacterium]
MISPPVLVNKSSGLTLIEIVIVVALMVVVMAGAGISINSIMGASNKRVYNNDLESIQTLIVKARAYAKASRLNDDWGIKELIANTTGCGATTATNCFVLFKGKDYAARSTDYDEVITFSSNLERYDNTNNESEIYWQKVTGWGRGFENASSTDGTGFRLRSADGTYDCIVKVGIFGVVFNSCE